jgi:hypothetical protein
VVAVAGPAGGEYGVSWIGGREPCFRARTGIGAGVLRDCLCPIGAAPRRPERRPLNHGWSSPSTSAARCCSSSEATTRTAARCVPAIPGRASAFAASAAGASLLVGAAVSWRPPGGHLVAAISRRGSSGSPVAETHGCSDQRRGPEHRLPGSLATRSAHRRAVSVATITPRSDHRSGEIAVS